MNLDILAYVILGLFFIFGVLPIIGYSMLGGVSSYTDSLKAGSALAITLAVFSAVMLALLWSLTQVGWLG